MVYCSGIRPALFSKVSALWLRHSNPSLSAKKQKNIRSAIALLMFFMSISKR